MDEEVYESSDNENDCKLEFTYDSNYVEEVNTPTLPLNTSVRSSLRKSQRARSTCKLESISPLLTVKSTPKSGGLKLINGSATRSSKRVKFQEENMSSSTQQQQTSSIKLRPRRVNNRQTL